MALSEKWSALDGNTPPLINTHITLELIHIRLKIPQTVQRKGRPPKR